STPNASSACASFSPPRDTYGGGVSSSSSVASSTCVPGFVWPRTLPASTSACACARVSASPRSTSRTSSRFFTLECPRSQDRDDLRQDGRVGGNVGEARLRAVGRLVRKGACTVRAVREDVPVVVEEDRKSVG